MKILIVDDNKDNLNLLEIWLKGSSYDVVSAANGMEALEKLRANGFDMIVSDILMPVMDGFELCRECKEDEKLKDIPFVFYTATYTDARDEELALKVGADKFIRKPTEPEEFIKIIEGMIRDVEEGKISQKKPVAEEEQDIFKLYSERVVNKLEKKMLDLEAEIARRKQVEEEREHLNMVLRAIRGVNQLIVKEKERDKLLRRVCATLIKTRGYDSTCICLFDESRMLVTHAEAGLDKDFLPMVERLKRGELTDCIERTLIQSGVVITEVSSLTCGDCPLVKTCSGTKVVTVRMEHGGKVYGLLRLSLSRDVSIPREEQSLLQEVTGDVAFALHDMESEEKRKRLEHGLKERVKELQCLYGIAGIAERPGITLDELYQEVANLLPPSWQYPEIACCRITINDKEFRTNNYKETEWKQASDIIVDGQQIGTVEVFYLEEKPESDEGPFLKEERNLISGIARQLGDYIQRKRAEEALRGSEDKYRKLFELGSDAIFLIEVETGRILDLNDTALKMYGYSREEALQMKNTDFSAEPAQTRQATVEHEQQIPVRYHKKKDGIIFPTDISVAYFTWYGKEVCIAAIRDITERKELEEERQRIERFESVGTLAGGIAHDFNNFLTGIIGNIGLAKRYVEPKSKAADRLLMAEKASLRAKDLTQQLLTFAKGGMPIRITTSIKELIEDSATFVLRGSNVKCEFSLPDNLWLVDIDKGQMSQVISNVVINADQAMPEGGTINIGAKNTIIGRGTLPLPEGEYIEITIEDHGMGISKSNLKRIFDPYFTTKQKGSGLGLITAYSIIKSHDGHITVKSTPQVGTTFCIYLPASGKQITKEKRKVAEETPSLGEGRILVMDDEEIIREMLSNMLALAGYEVELTEDGTEAIERYSKAIEAGQPFSAVIIDLTVPGGMGGKEAIKKLLEIDPNVKAIVSSGYATDPIMAEYREYGFKAVIAKPYSVIQLGKTLRDLLRGKK